MSNESVLRKPRNFWYIMAAFCFSIFIFTMSIWLVVYFSTDIFIAGLVFAEGAITFSLAVGMLLYGKYIDSKLKTLKTKGTGYEAEIVGLSTNYMIRALNYVPVYVRCQYENKEGNLCKVRSSLFFLKYFSWLHAVNYWCKNAGWVKMINSSAKLHTGDCSNPSIKDEIKAIVYVDNDNPKNYAVEILLSS